MTTKYNASLFDSLQEIISNKNNADSSFKDFLKFESDKTYVVRILPNVEDMSKTWYNYKQHIWDSIVHGKKISVICPNTYKAKCPICEYRSKIWATKNDALINQIKPLKKNEKWLYNVFVVKDPSNPSNEGQVKILNAGSQLQKIIESAISGDDREEFGGKIFDLSSKGCNLRIKVEKNEGGYPSYVASKFVSPSGIDGLDDEDSINSVYDSFKPLDTIFKVRTYEEIKDLLDIHFLGKDSNASTPSVDDDEEDFKVDDSLNTEIETGLGSSTEDLSDNDQKLKDILADL